MKRIIQIEGNKIVRKIPLENSEYTLGRGTENDIVFDTPRVSRLHAVLVKEGGNYVIIDKKSTNHVYVNGVMVKKQPLTSGDEINLSKEVTLLYLSESDTDEKAVRFFNRMLDTIYKKDFLRLKEVTNRIVSLDSLENILNIVLSEVVKLVAAERGFITLIGEKGEIQSHTSVVHNLPFHDMHIREAIFSHSTVQRAIQERETIFVLTPNADEEDLSNSIMELDLKSVMCAPLLFGDKLVGILYVDSGHQLIDFNEMDQFFFTILADHAAIAIENAKLYSQVQMSIQQLRDEVDASEERYRQTVEAAPDSIIIVRMEDGQLIQVNEAFCSVSGYTEKEALNKKVCDLKLFVDTKDTDHIVEIVKGRREIKAFETRIRRHDHTILDVLISARFLRLGDENCMVMVMTDITKRKKAEDALRLDESRLQALLELNMMTESPIRVIRDFALEKAVKLTKSEIGYIGFVDETQKLISIRSWSKNVMAQCALSNKAPVFKLDDIGLLCEPVRRRKPIITNDYHNENVAKRGYPEGHIPIRRHLSIPVFEGNQVVIVAGVANKTENYDESDVRQLTLLMQGMWRLMQRKEDEEALRRLNEELEKRVIERTSQLETANRNLEEAIQQAQKLARDAEAASVAKSEFLANMSHEIRTPMNGIIGTCELALSGNPNPKQREYFDIILTSASSLLGVINDILDFSKIEAGKLNFDNIPFSIREIVEEVCDIFFEKVSENDIELIVDIAPDAPDHIISDPSRLRQVLINLVSNAFKFTNSGEICISVNTIASRNNSACLLFTVRDTGIGIDPKIQDKLFDAFIQGDGTTTRKYSGTGLGLAICKKIVGIMGGDIWVESVPKHGSNFHFIVDFKTVSKEDYCDPAVLKLLDGLKVLIVEDNQAALNVIKRFLESVGCITYTAETAEAAKAIYEKSFESDGIELIVMDYKLPDKNGIDLADEIKKDFFRKAPPIIIISGYAQDMDIQRAKEIGVERCIIKPFKQSLLYKTILETMGFEISEPMKNAPAIEENFEGISVLLVEDNPTNRRVASEILEMAGIEVEAATSGLEAIKAVKRRKFDAVLMDVQMPLIDGIEATKIIRRELKMSDLPIIAMTAHAMAGDREKCLDAGMNGYVPKPISRKELFQTLQANILRLKELPSEYTCENVGLPAGIHSDSYPGLNITEGLKRLGGDWNRYVNVLHDFRKSHRRFTSEFKKLIEVEDFLSAANKAHSIKGAAGNIGADGLYESAKALERASENSDTGEIKKAISTVEIAIEQVLNTIKIVYPIEDKNAYFPDTGDDKEDIHFFMSKLNQSIEDSDPVSSESYFNKIKSQLDVDGFHAMLEKIEKALNIFDFEEARHLLQELSNSIQTIDIEK